MFLPKCTQMTLSTNDGNSFRLKQQNIPFYHRKNRRKKNFFLWNILIISLFVLFYGQVHILANISSQLKLTEKPTTAIVIVCIRRRCCFILLLMYVIDGSEFNWLAKVLMIFIVVKQTNKRTYKRACFFRIEWLHSIW